MKPSPKPAVPEQPIATGNPEGGLKRAAVRGWAVTMTGQGAKFFIQLASTAIIARQLSPEDYGLVAMVTSILGFITLFKDLGLSQAAIQRKTITPAQVNGLYWVNIVMGLIFTCIVAGIAPLVAKFYGRPELVHITLAYAAMIPIGSLGAQHSAMLQRKLQYTSLTIRDVAASLGGALAGIAAALYGYGYWSLVIMQAASVVFSTAALWWQSDWRPGLPRFGADLKPLLKFGSTVTLSNLLGFLMNGLDSVLLGYFIGPVGLGIYNRAQNTLSKPMQQLIPPVMNVAYGVFSRAAHDRQKFESAALQLGFVVVAAGGLIAALTMICADWIVLVVLGGNWSETVPIVRILALFAIVEPVASLLAVLLTAKGLPGKLVRWRIISAGLIIAGLVSGLPWGPLGVATAYALSGLFIRAPLFIWFAANALDIRAARMFASVSAPFVCSLVTAGLLFLLRHHYGSPPNTLVALAIYSMLGALFWLGALWLWPFSRTYLRSMFELARTSLKSPASSSAKS